MVHLKSCLNTHVFTCHSQWLCATSGPVQTTSSALSFLTPFLHVMLCTLYYLSVSKFVSSLPLHFSTLEEYEMAGTCCSHSAKSNCKDSCTLVCSVGMLWLHSLQWLLGLLSTWSLYRLKSNNACSDSVSFITNPVLPSNLFSSYPGLP